MRATITVSTTQLWQKEKKLVTTDGNNHVEVTLSK
jgi:hypothetical protein